MRHRKNFNHLGRKSAHRHAMLANMASSLIMHKRINTTVAKAKALRSFVEPLITRSKNDSTHSRRVVFSYLQNKESVSELFRDVASKVATREGGYTRILKTGTRLGDNAEMCMIELVDFNETYISEKSTKAKSSRKRRSGKKKTEAPVAESSIENNEVEEIIEDAKVENDDTTKEEKVVESKTESEAKDEKTEDSKENESNK